MKRNEGFSLVELIIVIAIMAILVGVISPQLIRYIEKTNVSADTQLCDAVRTAVMTVLMDPYLLTSSDPLVQRDIKNLGDSRVHDVALAIHDDTTSSAFTSVAVSNEVRNEIKSILGFDLFNTSEQRKQMKSTPAKTSGILCYYANGKGLYLVYIAHSDRTGDKQDYNPGGHVTAITKEIYVD